MDFVFSIVSTAVMHNPQLVESLDAEKSCIWRADNKILRFLTARKVCSPNPHDVQGSTVLAFGWTAWVLLMQIQFGNPIKTCILTLIEIVR